MNALSVFYTSDHIEKENSINWAWGGCMHLELGVDSCVD